jgi:hypothetical protein
MVNAFNVPNFGCAQVVHSTRGGEFSPRPPAAALEAPIYSFVVALSVFLHISNLLACAGIASLVFLDCCLRLRMLAAVVRIHCRSGNCCLRDSVTCMNPV